MGKTPASSVWNAIQMIANQIAERYGIHDLSSLIHVTIHIFYHVVFPVVASLLGLVVIYMMMKKIERRFFPPPPIVLYEEAIDLYQKGKIRETIKILRQLRATHHPSKRNKSSTSNDNHVYGLASLSLITHELYVAGDVKEGMKIIEETQQGGILSSSHQNVLRGMQEDAKAIVSGNSIMVKMNAQIAKQDYLGLKAT